MNNTTQTSVIIITFIAILFLWHYSGSPKNHGKHALIVIEENSEKNNHDVQTPHNPFALISEDAVVEANLVSTELSTEIVTKAAGVPEKPLAVDLFSEQQDFNTSPEDSVTLAKNANEHQITVAADVNPMAKKYPLAYQPLFDWIDHREFMSSNFQDPELIALTNDISQFVIELQPESNSKLLFARCGDNACEVQIEVDDPAEDFHSVMVMEKLHQHKALKGAGMGVGEEQIEEIYGRSGLKYFFVYRRNTEKDENLMQLNNTLQ